MTKERTPREDWGMTELVREPDEIRPFLIGLAAVGVVLLFAGASFWTAMGVGLVVWIFAYQFELSRARRIDS